MNLGLPTRKPLPLGRGGCHELRRRIRRAFENPSFGRDEIVKNWSWEALVPRWIDTLNLQEE